MKIKTISRLEEHYTRETKHDIVKIHRNLDPKLHPFQRATEYTRALTATKLDKIFAKPFIGALAGHTDGVYSIAVGRKNLVQLISGACDGEVRIWDLSHRRCVWKVAAHAGFVRGVAVAPDGNQFLSAGDDGVVRRWNIEVLADVNAQALPTAEWRWKCGFKSLDHHWSNAIFATCGEGVDIWDQTRSEPTHSFTWGTDSVNCVRFNPAEECLVCSTSSDRGAALYDMRMARPLRKVILRMKSNGVAWNPRNPFNFVLGNEDFNAYTFDMRMLGSALMIHKDHVGPIMGVGFSPSGLEFATAGYDRTVRIFNANEGRSREVYHTSRMQRLFCVDYTRDGRFVLTGSDDTNVRIWKARASERMGVTVSREKRKLSYFDSLKERYKDMPEIRRIAKHRQVPKSIRKATNIATARRDRARRKAENIRKHAKVPEDPKPEKERNVVAELK